MRCKVRSADKASSVVLRVKGLRAKLGRLMARDGYEEIEVGGSWYSLGSVMMWEANFAELEARVKKGEVK